MRTEGGVTFALTREIRTWVERLVARAWIDSLSSIRVPERYKENLVCKEKGIVVLFEGKIACAKLKSSSPFPYPYALFLKGDTMPVKVYRKTCDLWRGVEFFLKQENRHDESASTLV